jgi:deoxyadenosine/deoxycytidine kinase
MFKINIKMKHKIISIDGNIGAGKSTFLNQLKLEFPDFHYIDEPVDIWSTFKNEEGETLLEVYYKDKERWSYTFQNCVFLTRMINFIKLLKEHENSNESKIFITERFVDTDFNIFARMLHDDGFINKLEWEIYKKWYHYLTSEHKLSGVIYISCSAEKCYERINIRKRAGENNISLDYLKKLDDYHNTWLDNTSVSTLTINTNLNLSYLDENNKFTSDIKNIISEFMEN